MLGGRGERKKENGRRYTNLTFSLRKEKKKKERPSFSLSSKGGGRNVGRKENYTPPPSPVCWGGGGGGGEKESGTSPFKSLLREEEKKENRWGEGEGGEGGSAPFFSAPEGEGRKRLPLHRFSADGKGKKRMGTNVKACSSLTTPRKENLPEEKCRGGEKCWSPPHFTEKKKRGPYLLYLFEGRGG